MGERQAEAIGATGIAFDHFFADRECLVQELFGLGVVPFGHVIARYAKLAEVLVAIG
jgi:hypothetical protein